MNRTKIEYADYTWNPVVGCLHRCPYCYARRFAERGMGEYGKHKKGHRFQPRFFPERLQEPEKLKKPSVILVCSMGDLWGKWVPREWQEAVLDAIRRAPWHTFLLLTKRPWGYAPYVLPDNAWAGTTVTGPDDWERAWDLYHAADAKHTWISYEPVLGPISPDAIAVCDWLVIGAQTGPGARPPRPEWIEEITDEAMRLGIPVFMKDNLRPHWRGTMLRQLPWRDEGGEDGAHQGRERSEEAAAHR